MAEAGGGSFATPLDDTNAMMYASRMQYLHGDESKDRTMPDALFMSRKQAHKASAYHSTTTSTTIAGGSPKKNNHGLHHAYRRASLKGSSQQRDAPGNWQPVFQAGCHFWQNRVTGECVAHDAMACTPCPFHGPNEPCEWNALDDSIADGCGDDDKDVPFPPSFQFLDDHSSATAKSTGGKNKAINHSVHHIVMRKSER
ncbi:Aste57867_8833 [Aphanomyces stellatus]|uniref:Aste57867_8833 protein n=1 Tax=Aphanomyces stellatus TaxID=120398 RepID=A0A485KL89_9STRA|nr:hypothetical protein As57867_008798 [Aphanomyces stellatus]VFT85719.1 Aste57867_8833 [Aphanomyces stellatus]